MNNRIILTHNTAFSVYRQLRLSGKTMQFKPLKYKSPPDNVAVENKELYSELSKTYNLSQVDILLAKTKNCHCTKKVKRHCYTNTLPNGSFLEIDKSTSIVCPELLFCQLAHKLTHANLMILGLEMCGDYSLDPNAEKGFVGNLKPITSRRKIQNFIEKLGKLNTNFKGIKRAREIASFLGDGSASPQESRLYTALSLPHRLGGYCLTNAQLNHKITLSKTGRTICRQNVLVPDLSIRKNKIAIEYDSNLFHDNAGQNNKDKLRIDAYIHEG